LPILIRMLPAHQVKTHDTGIWAWIGHYQFVMYCLRSVIPLSCSDHLRLVDSRYEWGTLKVASVLVRSCAMNSIQIIQLGIVAILLVGFMVYALGVFFYIFSDRSIVDERLQRYCKGWNCAWCHVDVSRIRFEAVGILGSRVTGCDLNMLKGTCRDVTENVSTHLYTLRKVFGLG